MKFLFVVLAFFLVSFTLPWENDFSKAMETAKSEHKYILLNFSGSDWCGPCIRLHKEIFESEIFSSYAKTNLVLVNADFPRQKKNQLPKSQQKQNEMLAEKYNAAGNFPFTVLLNADGTVVKTWDGFPKQGETAFTNELKQATHAGN